MPLTMDIAHPYQWSVLVALVTNYSYANEYPNIFESKPCHERKSEYIRNQQVDTSEYPNIFVSKKTLIIIQKWICRSVDH